jgi:hypothetical protein
MSRDWTLVLFFIGALFLLWFMVRNIRQNPEAFSKENLGKSIYTMGILALIIIAIIFFCVWILRST